MKNGPKTLNIDTPNYYRDKLKRGGAATIGIQDDKKNVYYLPSDDKNGVKTLGNPNLSHVKSSLTMFGYSDQ